MTDLAIKGTTQEPQEEIGFFPTDIIHQAGAYPFKRLIRHNSVAGMTAIVSPMSAERKNKHKKPKATINFLRSLVAMKSGNELYHTTGNATYYIAVIPEENLVSTDEMITEAASELREKKEVENEIIKLLSWGSDIEFEQGMENDFTRALESMVLNYANLAIEMLSDAIKQRNIGEALISEMVQFLGIITDEETKFKRRLLLIDLLKSSSNIIRYGAIIGLESLNDPKALADIRAAAKNEQFPPLQTEMLEIADILGK